jgi:hypothetical protein
MGSESRKYTRVTKVAFLFLLVLVVHSLNLENYFEPTAKSQNLNRGVGDPMVRKSGKLS